MVAPALGYDFSYRDDLDRFTSTDRPHHRRGESSAEQPENHLNDQTTSRSMVIEHHAAIHGQQQATTNRRCPGLQTTSTASTAIPWTAAYLARHASNLGRDKKISLYVFGDEFTNDSIDDVLDTVDRLSRPRRDGSRRVRIHAIGFPTTFTGTGLSDSTGVRFAMLMRALCERNGGPFVGLTQL